MSHNPPVVGPRDHRPHYVYRIFDADDALLYVGCAEDVETRLSFHCAFSSQSPTSWEIAERMARHTSQEFPSKSTAHAEEIRAIKTEAPLLNRQHNITRFKREFGVYRALSTESREDT